MREDVGVVGAALLVGQPVQLRHHVEEGVLLGAVGLDVDEEVAVDEHLPEVLVAQVAGRFRLEGEAEAGPEVRQALGLRVDPEAADAADERLEAHAEGGRAAGRGRLAVAAHPGAQEALEDLPVGDGAEGLQQQYRRHDELLLAQGDAEHGRAGGAVVDRARGRRPVGPPAPHHHSPRCEVGALFRERRPLDGHGVVAPRGLQEADHLLQALDDKVPGREAG